MKTNRFFAAILTLVICTRAIHAEDADTAITKLTEDVAARVKDSGSKKITVLDFTDLAGKKSELGRYISEQMTVDFTMVKRDFSVLDRANQKRILDELNLDASGLVNPDNAKKLGKFSGVDAMVLGTVMSAGTNVSVTVKVISTETEEIVTSGKTKFTADDAMQQIQAQPTNSEAVTDSDHKAPPAPKALVTQQYSNLLVSVDKLIKLDGGGLMVMLSLQNKSAKNSIAVAMFHETCFVKPCHLVSSILAGDGTQFIADDDNLTGIGSTRFSPQPMTEILPGETAKASVGYRQGGWGGGKVPSNIISFTWRADMVVNQNYRVSDYDNYRLDENALPPHCKIQHISLDIQLPRDD